MLVLFVGVLALGGLFFWRMLGPSGPPLPPETPLPPQPSDFVSPSSKQQSDGTTSLSGKTMGTTYSIKFVDPVGNIQQIVQAKVDAALLEVNAAMSTYDQNSELSRLNRTDQDQAFVCSESLFFVLSLAGEINHITQGAFDVTVGPLVRAYGFGARAQDVPPTDAQLAKLRDWVGMHHLQLDHKAKTVTKDLAQVDIDLSAIAKGYGVDVVAQTIDEL